MANSSLFLEHHTFQYSWLNMVVPSAFFIHLPQLPYFQSPVDILVYNTEKRVGLYSFSVLIKLTQVSVFLQIVFFSCNGPINHCKLPQSSAIQN